MIADAFPATRFSILGECDSTVVVIWEDDREENWNEHLLAAEAHCGGAQYLLGFERDTGRRLWRQDGGWSSSRIVRSEGGEFWHVQQSCQYSLFAVKRVARDGAAALAVDLTALPPLDVPSMFGSSTLHASFAKEPPTCSFDRHLHRAAEGGFLEALFLEDATYAEGALWLWVSSPPRGLGNARNYLCAADFSRGIWAWYSLAGERFGKPQFEFGQEEDAGKLLPPWGRPASLFENLPMVFPDLQVRGEDGGCFQTARTEVGNEEEGMFWALRLVPVQAGRLDCSKQVTREPSQPEELESAYWLFFPWSPHVAIIWYGLKRDQTRVAYVDLVSLAGDLVKRIGPLDTAAGDEPFHFAAQEDHAVLATEKELYWLARSTAKDRGIAVTCDRLSTKHLPLADASALTVSDLKIIRDRIYAAIRVSRTKEGKEERRFCVASWSATDGAPSWVGDVE